MQNIRLGWILNTIFYIQLLNDSKARSLIENADRTVGLRLLPAFF